MSPRKSTSTAGAKGAAAAGRDGRSTLLVVDGGMLAGWRRATPSLWQLHQALFHLRAAHPEVRVTVVADPALKHALPAAEAPRLDADIETRALVLAPAGSLKGWTGFLAAVIDRARAQGQDVAVLTDRSVADAPLGRAHLDGHRWRFELPG